MGQATPKGQEGLVSTEDFGRAVLWHAYPDSWHVVRARPCLPLTPHGHTLSFHAPIPGHAWASSGA
jgi:hypothetical protein